MSVAPQFEAMTLYESIRTVPLPYEYARGQALSADWAATGDLAQLLIGIGGCSPYLSDVLRKEQAWICNAIYEDEPLAKILPDDLGPEPGQVLRQCKRRIAGFLAMAELSGAYALSQTTQALTDFADAAVQAAFKKSLEPYQASGKLSAYTGIFVVAMGKMGAGELNYSSDIDLIVMFDDRNMDHFEASKLRQILVRVTRTATKLLNDITEYGYVFRTDLRLRPDPSSTPICVGMSSALDYYESLGRTWERAAFIKARICAGDRIAGTAFLKQMVPFVWRRHLDFSAIEEAHALRLKIRTKTGGRGQINVPGHDVKLGRGGIREIEFFTQTRQLISGGRDPDLRSGKTLEALDQLVIKDWVTAAVCNQLHQSYIVLRHTEHAIQMIRDAQTQSIPQSVEGLARVAGLSGQTTEAFLSNISTHLKSVHDIIEPFFTPVNRIAQFVALEGHHDITQHWPSYAAMRSDRATALFETLRPELLVRLQNALNPKEALIHFDSFLKGLPAGIQVFSLFAANPKLVDLLTDIVVSAPALAQYLGHNSGVLDAVLSGDFFAPWPDQRALQEQLAKTLAGSLDYEMGLDLARIWTKERHFRIGVHLLQEVITPKTASIQYAQLAEAVLSVVFSFAQQDFARKYGKVEGADATILAMGSLGAGLLNSDSEFELILIFNTDLEAISDGPKSLACHQYFSRLTQALITALTAPTAQGRLYEVDMRLRPSGRSGPVATSLAGFEAYQRYEAWMWEHLALTRGRPITGCTEFCKQVEDLRHTILDEKADLSAVMIGVRDMRVRLAENKPQDGPWDIKHGPGGLQDIELLAQGVALARKCHDVEIRNQLLSGVSAMHLLASDLEFLAVSHEFLSDMRLLHRLMCGTDTTAAAFGESGGARVRRIKMLDPDTDLEHIVFTTRAKCATVIDQIVDQIVGQAHES
jgi:glutamate-ammonia-ligase adenylyltransferase